MEPRAESFTQMEKMQPPDLSTARTEVQACLDNNPPSQMVGLIQGFVDRLDATSTVPDTGPPAG